MGRVKLNDPECHMSEPKRQIVRSVATEEDFAALATTLKARGVDPDQVSLIQGAEGAAIVDRSGEHHGFFANVRRVVPMINNQVAKNVNAVEGVPAAGRWALALPAADEKAADELAETLLQHNARNVLWFGKSEMIKYGNADETPAG